MDTAHWSQGIGLMKPLEELVGGSETMISIPTNTITTTAAMNSGNPLPPRSGAHNVPERKARPPKEQALNCPRCNSANTKFCYYNNYSMTQPRYFCKTCRRYWTEGGSLRNVPVGGGSRKNKRSSSSSSSSIVTAAASAATTSSLPLNSSACSSSSSSLIRNPKFQHGQDLNLSFPDPPMSAMDLLRGGGYSPFMMGGDHNAVFSSHGFAQIHDFRPPLSAASAAAAALHFPLDPASSGSMTAAMQDGTNGRILFPFEDLRQVSSAAAVEEFEQKGGHGGEGEASGFWTGMMGGNNGGSW